MSNLPGDIVFRILSTFPPESTCRFRCICKHWYNSFDPHYFMESRPKHSITKSSSNFENNQHESVKLISPFKDTNRLNVEIVGSCDGLILLKVSCNGWFSKKSYRDFQTETHWLWNPSTEELKEILNPQIIYGRKYQGSYVYISSVTYAVGYNSNTNDHTIVVAICFGSNNICHGCKIQVYTSESNSWKTLPNIFPYEIFGKYDKPEVVFFRGAFDWIGRQLGSKKKCIISLDIHGENFKEVAVTPH
ncbi:F-box protein At3g08750-like [Papaver somniferum]|uniref:F-box protein At3g08750-like n=1 Tax=Papaver somniferum TaxID=3469 RepID=UPI000E6F5908|nr:F-box protein At3g08750-like [Papaver somniferum]